MSLDKVFEKKHSRDLSNISIKKELLGHNSRRIDFLKAISAAVKVESVHDLDNYDKKLFFMIQSETSLWIYSDDGVENQLLKNISKKNVMQKISMVRGIKRESCETFYYVERDQECSSGDVIMEFDVKQKGS